MKKKKQNYFFHFFPIFLPNNRHNRHNRHSPPFSELCIAYPTPLSSYFIPYLDKKSKKVRKEGGGWIGNSLKRGVAVEVAVVQK